MAERLAFVSPRYAGEGAVGGAETLLKNLAIHAARMGCEVDFLTTCAQSHYTWENTLKPGAHEMDGMTVRFFPVDARDEGTFLRIQRYEEGIIEDEQLASLYFLQFRLYRVLSLRHLERAEEFGRVGVQCPDAVLAGMISYSSCKEAFACSCRACDKKVLPLAHKIE